MSRTIKTTPNCKWGTFEHYTDDHWIGRSLEIYGEYSEYETNVFAKCLKPGDVAIDAGANIGTLTVPMAKMVGPTGKVYAVEPGVDTGYLLKRNLALNEVDDWTTVIPKAASDHDGDIATVSYNPNRNYPKVSLPGERSIYESGIDEKASTFTIDSLNLPRLNFLKIDVDGCELPLLTGMKETLKRCRPAIFIENEIPHKIEKINAFLVDAGYRGWWFMPPLYRIENHRNEKHNVFPGIASIMQIWLPDDEGYDVKSCDPVNDIRMDERIFSRETERHLKYVERNPNDLTSRLIAAHYLGLEQKIAEADALMDENLRRKPGHIATLAMRGLHELQKGNYKEGWPLYELRFHQKDLKPWGGHRKPTNLHTWKGERTDEPLLIWSEQGFGDSIMFARYYKHVLERAPNAILEVQPELFELFENSKIAKPGTLFRMHRDLPDRHGLACSLPSTPAMLGDDGSMIPITGPYLFADTRLRVRWRHIIGDRKIGICLEGSPRSERPYTRNVPFEMFGELELAHGPFFGLHDDGTFDSFASTAAAIMELDLVITVDTSIAHLAGALGKETWLLLAFDPDFRWGLEGIRTPWYPSMRIFRQDKVLDWKSVVAKVLDALDERHLEEKAA